MSFATDKWFKHLREEILIEGLNDIGLDETIKEEIRSDLPEASEKGRVWVGNAWKSIDGGAFIGYGWFTRHIKEEIAPLGKNFRGDEGNDIERNILWNLMQNYEGQSPGKWPKLKRKFANTAKKKGFSEDDIQDLLYQFEQLDLKCWNWFTTRTENIFTTLNQNPNNYEMIKEIPPSDWMTAENVCYEFQMNQENPEQIMHTFDDGSYWYNLETYRCGDEGDRMGHCGTDERGTLYSLRKKDKGKKNSTSYITISYNENNETIYQIKGRANTCPPEKIWPHIATFIDITGAQTLQESGEYSSEPEEFEQLGQWLSQNTGIDFEGSLERRVEEMTEACREWERGFREDYGPHTYFRQVVVDTDDMWDGEQIRPRWYQDDIDFITVQVNFDLEDKYLLRQPEDLGDELVDEIYEIIDDNDSNGVISEYGNRPDFSFIRAYSLEEATRKYHTHGYRSDKRPLYLEGDKTFLVVSDLDGGIESATDDLSRYEADNYHLFLNVIRDFINEVEESIDKIKLLLIEQEYIAKPGIISYKEKADETFNNFIVSTIQGRNQFQFILTSFGILFYTTPEEMQAIMQTDLLDIENFYKTNENYYSSFEFKNKIIAGLQEKENEAIDFAKRQMKLNFGEKYEQKIDSIWEKFRSVGMFKIGAIKNDMFAAFAVRQKNPDARSTERDYFSYKLSFDFNESTYPIFAPIVEYYDNNFDFVISVFDRVVKEYIKEAVVKHREKTQKADALPMQEGLIVEGLDDIGLSEETVRRIRFAMPNASEKGRVWIGNAMKDFAPAIDSGGFRSQFRSESKEFIRLYGEKFQFGDYNLLKDLIYKMIDTFNKWKKARKSFVKSSNKKGVHPELIQKITDFFDLYEEIAFNQFEAKVNEIITVLNMDPINYEKAILFDRQEIDEKGNTKYFYDSISDFPPTEIQLVNEKCYKYLDSIDKEDQRIIQFDNGSYWYDLKTGRCSQESERMGHCGTDNMGTLFSLRKKEADNYQSTSYVTISYNRENQTIYQIKGRFNKCPLEQYWPYIAEFVKQMGVEEIEEDGQYSGEEQKFTNMLEYLEAETPVKTALAFKRRARIIDEFRAQLEGVQSDIKQAYYENLLENNFFHIFFNDETSTPYWTPSIDIMVIEMPFRLHDTRIYNGREPKEATAISEEIYDVIKNRDVSNLFKTIDKRGLSFPIFANANTSLGARHKSIRNYYDFETNQGTNTYLVLRGLEGGMKDYVRKTEHLSTTEPLDYRDFLELVVLLIERIQNSGENIQKVLEKHKLLISQENSNRFKNFVKNLNNLEYDGNYSTQQFSNYFTLETAGKLFSLTESESISLKEIGYATGYQQSLGDEGFIRSRFIQLLKEHPEFPNDKMPDGTKTNKKGVPYTEQQFWEKTLDTRVSLVKVGIKGEEVLYYGIEIFGSLSDLRFESGFALAVFAETHYPYMIDCLRKAVKEDISMYEKQQEKDTSLPMQEAVGNPLDVRVYEMDFVMSYPLAMGFEMTDIHNIIRAIPDVTTVRTVGETKRTQGNRTVSLQRLKFALQGIKSRKDWIRQVLLPQIHKISSKISIHKIGKADLSSSSKSRLKEGYFDSSMRQSPGRTTPRPSIQGLIDDWVEGGVMYDQPTNLNLTRYSVMMPVEDLKHLCSRHQRKHGHHFDAGYEKFIQNGPRDPIYLAIGKNGRAKITGNEDDLRYAIKAGVEEVPVFISYQRQV